MTGKASPFSFFFLAFVIYVYMYVEYMTFAPGPAQSRPSPARQGPSSLNLFYLFTRIYRY